MSRRVGYALTAPLAVSITISLIGERADRPVTWLPTDAVLRSNASPTRITEHYYDQLLRLAWLAQARVGTRQPPHHPPQEQLTPQTPVLAALPDVWPDRATNPLQLPLRRPPPTRPDRWG